MKCLSVFITVLLFTGTILTAQDDKDVPKDGAEENPAAAEAAVEAEKEESPKVDEKPDEEEETPEVQREKPRTRYTYEPKQLKDEKLEISGAASVMLPFDSDMDVAFGVEAKFRYWQQEKWGWGGAVGYNFWSLSGPVDISGANFAEPVADGEITTIPLTALACYRWDFGDDMELIGDFGLRYAIVDSDVSVSTQYTDHFGRDVTYSTFVENEDHFMVAVGLDLRGFFGDAWFWLIGAEAQIDLSSDPNWVKEDVGNDFSSIAFRGGIGTGW
ncbi:MAG: hypothetical protein QGH15_15860 [Kiritimatiellia bacterium]|jgi:hypothetical protein|nr:hypothetical protein [Kiritimatiellia bacterium]